MSTKSILNLKALKANKNVDARNYWRNRLAGFEFNRYFDNSISELFIDERFAEYTLNASEQTNKSLIGIAESDKAKHIVLLSTLGILVYRLSRFFDIGIFSPLYTAEHSTDINNNIIPIRISNFSGTSFVDFVTTIRDSFIQDSIHGNYPIEKILNRELKELSAIGMEVEKVFETSAFEGFPLDMLFSFNVNEVLTLTVKFNAGKFSAKYIEQVAALYFNLLQKLIDNRRKDISEIEVIPDQERHQLLYDFNNTKVGYPRDETVISLFEKQVEKTPGHVALQWGSKTLSYEGLKERSDKIASYLQEKVGVEAGDLVGVMLGCEEYFIPLVLGILKAGGAYVPIDPTYPSERINAIIEDSQLEVLVTREKYHDESLRKTIKVVDLDQASETITAQQTSPFSAQVSSSALAYVIYTSGSTGKPKGVMIEHRSLVNYIRWAAEYYVKHEEAAFALFTSIAFDLTVTSVFTPLITGNKIVMYEEDNHALLVEKVFSDNEATIVKLTPSHLKIVRDSKSAVFSSGSKLKTLIVGGEELRTELADAIYNKFEGRVEICNEYGPTEATVGCMIHKMEAGSTLISVPLGIPVNNTQIYLLDSFLKPVPLGAVGELYISGDGLARGYLNNESLSKESFIANPFVEGERMYKTGDLAVRHFDGVVLFKGRVDDQVKLRGFRIELGEIVSHLAAHIQVKEAVVVVKENEEDEYLVAYYVSEKEIEASELKSFLGDRLPEYMIPPYYVRLERMPLTSNGKLDRKSLPDPAISANDYEAPSNEVEEKLVEIWSEVLKIDREQIGVNNSFFALGGNSLKIVLMLNKLSKELNVLVPINEVFNHQEIKSLSLYIQKMDSSSYSPIKKVSLKEYYKLSSVQKRLYFIYEYDKKSLAYNNRLAIIIKGELNREQLAEVFQQLIGRHESLRTSFEVVDDAPVQKISELIVFAVEEYKSDGNDEQILQKFIRPFDLTEAPLFRVGLIEISSQEHILMVDMHHIITDGVSKGILIKDFMALYNGEELPELKLQYKDYAEWQQSDEQQTEIAKQKDFWINEFSGGAEILDLPTDFPRPSIKSFAGSSVSFEISEEATGKLKAIAEAEGVTMFMMVLSVYNIFLRKLSNQEDIVIGTPTAGRQHPDLENIVGMFVNTLVLRNYPKGNLSFKEFLSEVKSRTLACFDNQAYPYEELIDNLGVRRDPSRNPLFDVVFIYQNFEEPTSEVPALIFKPYDAKYSVSQFDFTLTAFEREKQIFFQFEYATDFFKEETIEKVIVYFKKVVSTIVDNVYIKISDIKIITQGEEHQLLYDFNNTKVDYPRDETIISLFEKQVEKTPGHVALQWGSRTLSYEGLKERSDKIASYLREKVGVEAGDLVGVMLGCEEYFIPLVLGILKAGGAYVPIDPTYPSERINAIIEDSQLEVLVTREKYHDESLRKTIKVVDLDRASETITAQQTSPFIAQVSSSALAYVIYTSGSTGKPKGVMIEHRSLVNYIRWAAEYYVKHKEAAFALFTSIAFDLTVTSVFTPLITGNKIVMYEEDNHALLVEKVFSDNEATIVKLTPSHLKIVRDSKSAVFSSGSKLKTLIVGGEELRTELADAIYNKFEGRVEICNEYGPTEATVGCMIHKMEAGSTLISVPLGIPVNNTQIYLLDSFLKPVPLGAVGELYISGDGLARGYLNNESLSKESFIANPFVEGERMYKTGDLAVRHFDGVVLFKGRVDDQVKLRGFRIELGEIVSHLAAHIQVKEAVVVVKENEEDQYLVAYYVSEKEIEASELRSFLGDRLPEYMIPSYYVRLERMPLTSNGKLDRKSLPDPAISANDYIAPSNEVEEKLVEIWSEVLKIDRERIGVNSNFFELGGNSIKTVLMLNKVLKGLNVLIAINEVFDHQDIKSLSLYIQEKDKSRYSPILKAASKEYYKLSSEQQRLYFVYQYDKQSLAYNTSLVTLLKGDLNRKRLVNAFQQLIVRHESLRTCFDVIDSVPVQKILELGHFEMEYFYSNKEQVDLIIKDFIRPFDLTKAPLLRAGLIETSPQEHVFVIDMHHIITDGVSQNVLIQDLMVLYNGDELSELRLQYKDYAEWQQLEKQQEEVAKQKDFWISQFSSEMPKIELPIDFARPSVKHFAGNSVGFEINEEVTDKLRAIAKAEGATMFMFLLSIFNIFLSKLSNSEDIVIGTPTAGRQHADLESITGMFINTLVLRNYPEGSLSFREFLSEVKSRALACFDNQSYQYETLVEDLKVARDSGRNPLFDIRFVFQNFERSAIDIPGLSLIPYDHRSKTSQFDLTLHITETNNQVLLDFTYSIELFKEETINRFIVYFQRILSTIMTSIDIKISDIEIITDKEKQQLIHRFNDTRVAYPKDKTFVQLFEEQVAKTPNCCSVVYNGDWVTYKQLDERSNAIAQLIQERHKSSKIAAIYVNPSIEMIIGILGILKSGLALLPLDPNQRSARQEDILRESKSGILVTLSNLVDHVSFSGEKVLLGSKEEMDQANWGKVNNKIQHSDLAYIIYTSGSSGKPKGVKIKHSNLVNYVLWLKDKIGLTSNDKSVLTSSYAFDLGYSSIFPILISGGELHIIPQSLNHSPDKLLDYVGVNKITYLKLTPSLFTILASSPNFLKNTLNEIRYILLGGERIKVEDIEKAHQIYDHIKFINHYGPTETTIGAVAQEIVDLQHFKSRPTIGKPIHNTQVFILDKNLKLLPFGVIGELCIGGHGVGVGYLDREELTEDKFVANPFISGERMYKTGDLARWHADGTIEFLGRIDNQIKIRGFRVELGEIEAQLSAHNQVKDSIVMAKEKEESNYLVAYYVSENEINSADLKSYLSDRLPDYMVPSYYVRLERMPLTSNGKLDRKSLPDHAISANHYVAPSNEVEGKLVEIWSKALNLEKKEISVNESFFDLGGHSLIAPILISNISKELNIPIHLRILFQYQTISALSSYISENLVIEQANP